MLTRANPLHIGVRRPEGRLTADDRSRSRSVLLIAPRGTRAEGGDAHLAHHGPVAGPRSARTVLREACFKALLHRRVSGARLGLKPDLTPRPSMGFGPPSRCAPRHSPCGRRAAAPPKRCPECAAEAVRSRETCPSDFGGPGSTIPLVLTARTRRGEGDTADRSLSEVEGGDGATGSRARGRDIGGRFTNLHGGF